MICMGRILEAGQPCYRVVFPLLVGAVPVLRRANFVDYRRGGWYRYRSLRSGREWSEHGFTRSCTEQGALGDELKYEISEFAMRPGAGSFTSCRLLDAGGWVPRWTFTLNRIVALSVLYDRARKEHHGVSEQ